jgi:hypothetical protein
MLCSNIEPLSVLLISETNFHCPCLLEQVRRSVRDDVAVAVNEGDVGRREYLRPAAVLYKGVLAAAAGEEEGSDEEMGLCQE